MDNEKEGDEFVGWSWCFKLRPIRNYNKKKIWCLG